uniref:Uncharacterized protein n=1 Tax=uncultured Desulfobacterium sp. TaxID=201089 RepID=E1YHK1_9BACT|nr:unknown protein [uncultured Desulfobacterium sp.]
MRNFSIDPANITFCIILKNLYLVIWQYTEQTAYQLLKIFLYNINSVCYKFRTNILQNSLNIKGNYVPYGNGKRGKIFPIFLRFDDLSELSS